MSEVHGHETPEQKTLTSIAHHKEMEVKEHKGTTNQVDSVLK